MLLEKNTDLLAVSCDNYSDLWNPFFTSLFKFWPNCNLDVHLLSNHKSYENGRVSSIVVGDDISWSDNLLKCLNNLHKEYVLIFIEDCMLNKKVDNLYFKKLISWVDEHSPNYLRLNISHKPDYYDDLVGSIPIKTAYKTSTLPCLWKRTVLQELLKPGESAWDFEIFGSVRAYKYGKFFAVYNSLFSFENGVIKGKWRKSTLKKLKQRGVKIDTSSRDTMSSIEELLYQMRVTRSVLFNQLPNFFRRSLKQ